VHAVVQKYYIGSYYVQASVKRVLGALDLGCCYIFGILHYVVALKMGGRPEYCIGRANVTYPTLFWVFVLDEPRTKTLTTH